jgi:hypothetical protein
MNKSGFVHALACLAEDLGYPAVGFLYYRTSVRFLVPRLIRFWTQYRSVLQNTRHRTRFRYIRKIPNLVPHEEWKSEKCKQRQQQRDGRDELDGAGEWACGAAAVAALGRGRRRAGSQPRTSLVDALAPRSWTTDGSAAARPRGVAASPVVAVRGVRPGGLAAGTGWLLRSVRLNERESPRFFFLGF